MRRHCLLLASIASSCATLFAGERFAVETKPDCLIITRGGEPVATYVFRDERVLRPHFKQLHAPGGMPVTRNHPPVAGVDATDHDTMHPGLWLAFGDVSGNDFWRNKAVIRHERFTASPAVRDGVLTFATENTLQSADGQIVCEQISCITLLTRPCAYLLIWDATFRSDRRDFAFGDQEEMGFGVRVATAITQKNGGVIRNSAGEEGAGATWGKTADWCDYSRVTGDHRGGILLMPDPRNFQASWFHNRDYGLMVANPFGRNAFTGGEKSAVTVRRGETFRLRFGVLLHAASPDLPAEYERFKRALVP